MGRVADKPPVVTTLARLITHPYKHPGAGQLLAAKPTFQFSGVVILVGVPHRFPIPVIPDDHGTGTVFTFGDYPFERGVREWVILHMHCEATFSWIEGDAFRDGSTFEDSVELQTQVEVQVACGVLLNDQSPMIRGAAAYTLRCGSSLEMSLAAVVGEGHPISLRRAVPVLNQKCHASLCYAAERSLHRKFTLVSRDGGARL